jgi:hypothetical protein
MQLIASTRVQVPAFVLTPARVEHAGQTLAVRRYLAIAKSSYKKNNKEATVSSSTRRPDRVRMDLNGLVMYDDSCIQFHEGMHPAQRWLPYGIKAFSPMSGWPPHPSHDNISKAELSLVLAG